MTPVGDPERVTQSRVVQLFRSELGYRYLGDRSDNAANSNVERLVEQIKEFRPAVVAMGDTASAEKLKNIVGGWRQRPEVWNHNDGIERLARHEKTDIVLCGMVGSKGLLPLVEE